jgi:hypothetical protein
MFCSQSWQKVNCSSPTLEIADFIGLCSRHFVSVVILDHLSLEDFFTSFFLDTVSIAGGSDKLRGTNHTNSDIVRCITYDRGHILGGNYNDSVTMLILSVCRFDKAGPCDANHIRHARE